VLAALLPVQVIGGIQRSTLALLHYSRPTGSISSLFNTFSVACNVSSVNLWETESIAEGRASSDILWDFRFYLA
jgi:hypothetical protein